MQNQWMNRSILAASISFIMVGVSAHAETAAANVTTDAAANASSDVSATPPADNSGLNTPASNTPITSTPVQENPVPADNTSAKPEAQPQAVAPEATPSMVPPAKDAASGALQQKEGDASTKTNLEEVFTRTETQYSLSKRGSYSATYDVDYTYYRDSRLDLALDDGSSDIRRLRIEEDAQHTLTNTFTFQYGLLDNLTLTASLPLVAKMDNLKDETTAGLGDLAFGARWEPFPLKQGRLPLILFGSLSTKTGDSPYEVNPITGLSTGKGYYSVGGGASTRKFIDPVVLFASVSANYGFKETDINQRRGTRVLEEFEPGISGGISFGFAYSFNYDVSLTMSYQQSFNTASKFTFNTLGKIETSEPADQTSASMGFSLGVRVSPQTIVNTSVGFGLTEDAPDVSLGLSFPLDFLGFGREVR